MKHFNQLTKKERIGVVRLLKKAKAYLNGSDKLVLDWSNFYEYKDGSGSGCSSLLTKKTAQKICRVCALGASAVTRYSFKLDKRDAYARMALEQVSMGCNFDFGSKHSLEEVHDLYNRAISYMENI